MVAASTDITEHRRVQEELLHAKEAAELARQEAEGADRAKSTFLASMSHELRTPLNAIIGYSEILAESAEDAGLADDLGPDLQRIESSGRHLLGLINDILDLSKVEAGKMQLFVEEVDVRAVVDEVLAAARPQAQAKGLALESVIAGDVGPIRADVMKLRQSLQNLVGNACKFTEGGRVEVRVTRRGDSIAFAVADTGIGITAEQSRRLFQPFTQIDGGATRRQGGTGLGLALSRKLVRLMGGDITVESEPGRGSTFTLVVPCVVEAPPA
jgi:signal transduction histidine kinase